MVSRLSRRKIANYYAAALISGQKPNKLSMQLAAYLIETRRTKELPLFISEIEYQLSLRGTVIANVSSAHELSVETKKMIINLVKKQIDNASVHLSESIDQDLLGGIRLEFADSQLDTTIRRRLTTLKQTIGSN